MGRHKPTAEVTRAFLAQLSDALARRRGTRSYSALEQDTGINRLKLTALQEKQKLPSLTPAELIALNSLLRGKFSAILDDLRGTSLVDLLADSDGVTFLLGARPLQYTDHVSRWDVRAMTVLLRLIQQQAADPPEFHVEDDLRAADGLSAEEYLEDIAHDLWFRALDESNNRAVVAFGNGRASQAAEYMLARMFQVEPFQATTERLPFAFLWSDDLHARIPSAFSQRGELDNGYAPKSGLVGIRIQNQVYPIDDQPIEWDTYGIGAAQRRPDGQLWIVLAGATGPATSAVAELLPRIRGILPSPVDGGESAPIWFAVVARTTRDASRGGDNRVVVSKDILQDLMLWDPVKRLSLPLSIRAPDGVLDELAGEKRAGR